MLVLMVLSTRSVTYLGLGAWSVYSSISKSVSHLHVSFRLYDGFSFFDILTLLRCQEMHQLHLGAVALLKEELPTLML